MGLTAWCRKHNLSKTLFFLSFYILLFKFRFCVAASARVPAAPRGMSRPGIIAPPARSANIELIKNGMTLGAARSKREATFVIVVFRALIEVASLPVSFQPFR